MDWKSSQEGALLAFILILFAVFVALVWGVYRATQSPSKTLRAGLGVSIWFAGLSAVVQSGFTAEAPMPRLMIFFGLINFVSAGFAFTSVGTALATTIPISLLVLFQSFRLPLELVLHEWVNQGVIPETMTWHGSNFDIFSGVAALLAALGIKFFSKTSSLRIAFTIGWIFNGIGIFLLLNVMRVAIFSSPLPFAWQVNPPLMLGFHLPYALIVPVCVGGALFGHVVLTRALLMLRK